MKYGVFSLTFISNPVIIFIKKGERSNGEEGIRIQQPDGSFSYPYYFSDIEELFTAIWEDK